ncbi:MAG: DUF3996 domain-containing protein [Balneola sp.]
MNLKTLLTVFTLLISTSSLSAQNEGFAVGAQMFSPTGITAKATISETAAITGVVGFNFNEFNNFILLQTNLILNGNSDAFDIESGILRPYYGVGVNFTFSENSDTDIGFRIPLGMEYSFQDQPFEMYMDIAPTVNVERSSAFFLSSSMGFRYFF